MQDLKKLEAASIEELFYELKAREAEKNESTGPAAATARSARDTRLREFDSATLAETLRGRQEVVYGVDDRQDVFQVTDPAILNDVDSVVALFRAGQVTDNGN